MTIPQDSNQRPLRWPLTLSGGDDVFDGSPDDDFANLENWPTLNSSERVNVVFNLSLDEYVAIGNCVDVGRDIAYNENGGQIWYVWIRMLESMTICDDVADCIETSQAVQDAIDEYLINNSPIDPNTVDPDQTNVDDRFPDTERDVPLLDPPAGCDKDILWGGCKEIAIRLDSNARTILEQAITINDTYERYADMVSFIPIIGDLARDISNQFTEIIPDIYNSFNAYSSDENIEILACSFFELVCNECEYPTYDDIANIVADNAFSGLLNWETMTLGTIIGSFMDIGAYTPTLVWHSFVLFELFTVYLGAKFGSASGHEVIEQWALLGEDEPSNDWEILCSGCAPEWCYELDLTLFTNFDFSSEPGFQSAGILNGTVWDASDTITGGGANVRAIGVEGTLPFDVDIERFETDYDATFGGGSGTKYAAAVQIFDGAAMVYNSYTIEPNPPTGIAVTWGLNLVATGDRLRFIQIVDNTNGTLSGSGVLSKIRLYGSGANPFGPDNC